MQVRSSPGQSKGTLNITSRVPNSESVRPRNKGKLCLHPNGFRSHLQGSQMDSEQFPLWNTLYGVIQLDPWPVRWSNPAGPPRCLPTTHPTKDQPKLPNLFQAILRWKGFFEAFVQGLFVVLWVGDLVLWDASGDDDLGDLLDLAPADRTGFTLWGREDLV